MSQDLQNHSLFIHDKFEDLFITVTDFKISSTVIRVQRNKLRS